MNDARRKALKKLIGDLQQAKAALEDAKSEIENLKDEEQEYYDNMPQSLQGGDKGEQASQAVSTLEDAINDLDNIDLDDIVGKLEEASE